MSNERYLFEYLASNQADFSYILSIFMTINGNALELSIKDTEQYFIDSLARSNIRDSRYIKKGFARLGNFNGVN
jgi:hypothetical protein